MEKGRFWNDFWHPPDELILEIGAFGEVLIAKARVFLCLACIAFPVFNYFTASSQEFLIASVVFVLAITHAVAIYRLSVSGPRRSWPKYLATIVDISLVTLVMWFLAFSVEPTAALNTRVVEQLYLVVIFTTVLRGDYRQTVLAGGLAFVYYSVLIAYVMLFTDLSRPEISQPLGYGTVNLGDQLSRLVVIAIVTVLSVVVIRRHIHLIHLSCLDPLTRLFNRNYLDMRARSKVGKTDKASVMLMDVDFFKNINDEHGHPVGDRVLQLFAQKLQDMCLMSDVICRFGGEEFLVIVRDESAESVLQRANQIRKLMSETRFKARSDNENIRLTVSIGVASIPQDGADMNSIIKQADQRLLAAKTEGRNRAYGHDYDIA